MQAVPREIPLEESLQAHFGFGTFRAGQRELIEAVLSGGDALGVLPTGGGKSLTYQLPALLRPGLTVVVSPLIALMKDQVDAFNRRGKSRAVTLHSNLDAAEGAAALEALHRGEAALLYVAPERLETPAFRARLRTLRPVLFAIDEAHCISHWGHDFRPSYRALREILAELRPCPALALTATATPATRRDIVAGLGLHSPRIQVAPFDRPNLRFEVHPCGPDEKLRRLRRILSEMPADGSQIVYVGRRKDATEVAADLNEKGPRAVAYHAGLHPKQRRIAQEAWLSGERPIAVATVAFGMGIDKPDVRAVIHYQHPASLEHYYQEAGRAGRDGGPARCITLFGKKDVALAEYFIRNRYPNLAEIRTVFKDLRPGGTPPDALSGVGGEISDEQRNVALLALLEQSFVWRDEEGNFRRKEREAASLPVSLENLEARRRADYRRLDAVKEFCGAERCHRSILLRYFGEPAAPEWRCENCSACSGGTAEIGRVALSDEARRILSTHRSVLRAHGGLEPGNFARFLGGSRSKKVPTAWRKLPGFGALSHFRMRDLRKLARSVLDVAAGSKEAPGGATKQADPASGESPVYRLSRERTFTREELEKRAVPPRTGIAILALVARVDDGLAPSGVANVLRGAKTCDAVRAHPQWAGLPEFGRLRGMAYADLIVDVLAMYAKGYLERLKSSSKKLVLSDLGRAALKAKRALPAAQNMVRGS